MKKLLKYSFFSIFFLIFTFYFFLASYLWINQSTVNANIPKDSLATSSIEPHDFILINSGTESLKRRVDAINSAKESIEMEYFIYELDLAAQIISYKLIEAAKKGINVKVLVDSSAPVFKLRPEYANYLMKEGIKVKYYNNSPITNFIDVQHRSHRKFLIIDSSTLITGGRNIADDYFDLSASFNFLDSDVEITGPIVKDVQKSFYNYWESNFSEFPNSEIEISELEFVNIELIERKIDELSNLNFKTKKFICNDIDFVTDSPGIDVKNRKIFPYLLNKIKSLEKEIIVESPYFVLKDDGFNIIKNISDRNLKQVYLTNSLYSTDAYYTVSTMLTNLDSLSATNADVYLYNGKALENNKNKTKRWGLHAKRAVLDSKHTLIGTYNIDPRSANLNSEVLIACNNNAPIAKATLESMNERRLNSWKLFEKNKSALRILTKKSSFNQKLKFYLVFPIAKLFDFLL